MIFILFNMIRHLLQPLLRVFRRSGPDLKLLDPAHKRVVVLGGGVAGVCAAFWLSAPEQRGRYRVTLYTQGWRLGGKCASGRNPEYDRIEEHGLHILLGCYHNAFHTLRTCYEAWQRPASHPFHSWRDAFKPQRSVTLMEQDGAGAPPAWSVWDFPYFPAWPGEPGDAPAAHAAGLDTAVLRMLDVLESFTPQLLPDANYRPAVNLLRRSVTVGGETTRADAPRVAGIAAAMIQPQFTPQAATTGDATAKRIANLARLGLIIGAGYVKDVLGGDDGAIDGLNQQDFRAWLKAHGAGQEITDCAPVRAMYDLAFAYADGDASSMDNGTMAAGVTLRFILEVVFAYRDAPLWRMAAGTGDTVFAPLYRVLQQRGVDVCFFHRVTTLRPSADCKRLGEVVLSEQVAIKGGQIYDPLCKLGELDVWPNQPKWALLDVVPGPAPPDYELASCTASVGPPITLSAGQDFDLAVVALPPAILRTIAAPLAAINESWRTALDASLSVATQALQIWLRPDAAALGWPLPPAVLTSYAEPLDSWGDMSAVVRYESWPPEDTPGSLAYFCGCLKVGAAMDPAVAADAWLTAYASALWPAAPPFRQWTDPGGVLLRRYDRANTDPTELYVQTPYGDNVGSRLRPEEKAGFDNLYVVGDWTRTRFSGGCFESAVESAMLASNGISGFPQKASIKTA